jgi:PERQ amino acid-rich with GYF domain-containing protein
MVMPDRMRWIYRDPQGNIQGPWSGLEMHDWFKAGFFTAELQVKKLEDPEFEPLAQLVRRIGNSREPFLVPQIGIPHGPEPNQAPAWGGTSQPGTAQPPFANSFPTFGTTLTAEQQNALERRKQEEQYLMARQKEHLAQQQAMMKQMQLQGGPPQLQHHSSAHSLHSQPSFGSITSPTGGYQQSPIQGPIQPPQPMPGYFDAPFRQNALPLGPQMLGTDFGSQDELPGFLDRLNINRPGPFPLNTQGSFSGRQQEAGLHPQQINSVLQDRARLQQEQEQYDKTHPDSLFEQQARDERLRQFHALRSDEDEALLRGDEILPSHSTSALAQQVEATQTLEESESLQSERELEASTNEPLSLSQQVQKAATAQRQQQQQQKQAQAEAAWAAKGDPGIPHPFPPPPSSSPLPAPAAQRNRQHVADALAATSRSQNQTPIETPSTSIAPWAKDSIEAPKGPSLKEIQEAEARSAAQREELAAQARRAQLLAEQERLSQAQQATAPGLPSTANWASSASPVTPSAVSSVWSKPVAKPSSTPTKTLAQIQKEEEIRKQKLAQVTAVQPTVINTAAAAAGKRYADLASKGAASPTSTASGAWTTVGVGGKAKAPPVAPVGPRSTSATIATPPTAKPRPVAPVRTATVGSAPATNPNRANEEFIKWAKITLGKGLNNGIIGMASNSVNYFYDYMLT